MQPGIGKKRVKNQPVFYDEKKENHMVVLTPTAWTKLHTLAIDEGLSISEYLERLIRKIDSQ